MKIIARDKFHFAAALFLLLTTTVSAIAANPPPPPAVAFEITWLDDAGVFDASFTDIHFRGINNLGDAVGYAFYANTATGWMYTAETGTFKVADVALPPVEGDTLQIVYTNGINDHRQIVGNCYHNGNYRPFRLSLPRDPNTGELVLEPESGLPVATRIEILPQPAGTLDNWATPVRINNHGDVSITWKDVPGTISNRVALHANGGYINTSARREGNWRDNSNDLGVIVGAHKSATNSRTYAYRSTLNLATRTEQSFTTFPGFVNPSAYDTFVSSAHGINNAGDIVGAALFTPMKKVRGVWQSPKAHAFRRSGTTMTDLGTLSGHSNSRAQAINSVGDVIGYSGFANVNEPFPDSTSGFLWTVENKMHDLDTLVIPDLRWVSATSILPNHVNNPATPTGFGQIGGQAMIPDGFGNSYWRPFILTPIE